MSDEIISAYLAMQSDTVAVNFKNKLPVSVNFLASIGVSLGEIPSKEQYKQLGEYLQSLKSKRSKRTDGGYEPKTLDKWLSLTQRLYEYAAHQEGDITYDMFEDENRETLAVEQQQPARETTEAVKHVGRKTLDASGELRNKKIMLYVTATTMNKLKELAVLYHTSIAECVIGLINSKYSEKEKKIQELSSMFETF